jgi:hypothetical protein
MDHSNDIWRLCYELSKQVQGLHIDVALLSQTHLKSHERFFIPDYHIRRTASQGEKAAIPHNHVDLPPFVSTDATEGCMTTGNGEVLLAAVYKSPSHTGMMQTSLSS